MLSEEQQAAIVAKQVREWTAELRRLAEQIAGASGANCAIVLISAQSDDYADTAPELILEDALRVQPHGWPHGFVFDILISKN